MNMGIREVRCRSSKALTMPYIRTGIPLRSICAGDGHVSLGADGNEVRIDSESAYSSDGHANME